MGKFEIKVTTRREGGEESRDQQIAKGPGYVDLSQYIAGDKRRRRIAAFAIWDRFEYGDDESRFSPSNRIAGRLLEACPTEGSFVEVTSALLESLEQDYGSEKRREYETEVESMRSKLYGAEIAA